MPNCPGTHLRPSPASPSWKWICDSLNRRWWGSPWTRWVKARGRVLWEWKQRRCLDSSPWGTTLSVNGGKQKKLTNKIAWNINEDEYAFKYNLSSLYAKVHHSYSWFTTSKKKNGKFFGIKVIEGQTFFFYYSNIFFRGRRKNMAMFELLLFWGGVGVRSHTSKLMVFYQVFIYRKKTLCGFSFSFSFLFITFHVIVSSHFFVISFAGKLFLTTLH